MISSQAQKKRHESMIKGADISHYQGIIDWDKVSLDFVISKCTEYDKVDAMYQRNRDGARSRGILFGSYHFARGTDPVKEADFFVKSVGDMKAGELLALDWEISHNDPVGWCKKWLARVNELVGFRPLVYMNSSTSKRYDWSPISGDNGLWVAQYGVNDGQMNGKPDIGASFPWWVIWQYTSRGRVNGIQGNVDLDVLGGMMTLDQLKKYGKPAECSHCTIHCPR